MRLWTRFNGKDPRNCHYCAFWDGNVYTIDAKGRRIRIHQGTGCVFGCENCPFVNDLEPPPPPEPKHECCKGCPYGAHQPCIGWCTRKRDFNSRIKCQLLIIDHIKKLRKKVG